MIARDEARIRRAIHYAILYSREHDGEDDLVGIFDLVPFLSSDAKLIVKDETALTLAELVGCD